MLWPTPKLLFDAQICSFTFFLNLLPVKPAQIGMGYGVTFDLHASVDTGFQFLPIHHIERRSAPGLGRPIIRAADNTRCEIQVRWNIRVFQDRKRILIDRSHTVIKGNCERVIRFRAEQLVQTADFDTTFQNLFDHSGKGCRWEAEHSAPVVNAVESEDRLHMGTV